MDQEPQAPQEPAGSDGKPGIFQNINTTVAGITGLVVALGGLAAATKGVVWDKEEKTEQPAKADSPSADPEALPVATPETISAVEAETLVSDQVKPPIFTGDLFADGKFEGGAMSLKFDGEKWTLSADQTYEYEPIMSADPDKVLAYSADYDSYLRWPIEGGLVEESTDRKKSWSLYARVTASQP
jgi:hypothetical protein